MAISFTCECGKVLRARDDLAGKKARCPQCSAIVTIPGPAAAVDVGAMAEAALRPPPARDEAAPTSSTYRIEEPGPTVWTPPTGVPSRPKAKTPTPAAASAAKRDGDSSLLEYSYLLLAFALIPLMFSLLGKESEGDLPGRLEKTIAAASPEEQKRIEALLSRQDVTLDQALAAMPGGKLDGAHLARDSSAHWAYAAIAAVGFLAMLGLLFSVERANPLHLLGVGAFTGTIGIVFLLLVQLCSNIRLGRFHGRGWVTIILLILAFIGWSYGSATDPDSNFLLSTLGFTFGVGLCEEFTKAIPLFLYFKRDARMGWRGACVWGLASGIGFGVSEGIMYSSRHYNGVGGVDIYLVRFISCVALHAMWSASVGIAIARNLEEYERVEDAGGFGLFMLRVIAVPMVLHGFYDTLLKKDMNVWALVVALMSFAWFAWHIELARRTHAGAGRSRLAGRSPAW
jgi:RsiW-degrading membrane proteinase PrsW (M82 family)